MRGFERKAGEISRKKNSTTNEIPHTPPLYIGCGENSSKPNLRLEPLKLSTIGRARCPHRAAARTALWVFRGGLRTAHPIFTFVESRYDFQSPHLDHELDRTTFCRICDKR